LKTPKQLSFGTPGPSHGVTQGNNADFLANAQHIISTPDFSALQVDRQASFGSTPKAENQPQTIAPAQPSLSLDTSSFNSAGSIQTPPPTTTSASKRQGKKVQIHQSMEEAGSSRRKSVPILPKPTPDTTKVPVEASPDNFAGLDFSPAEFGWAPATAPAYPQQKLFWDGGPGDGMNLDLPELGNAFGHPRQSGLEAFVSNHPSVSNSQQTVTNDFIDFPDDTTPVASFQNNYAHDSENDPLQSISRSIGGVDPSLLFSSPGKLAEAFNTSVVNGFPKQESLQPYAYQLQEARREKAYSGVVKPKRRRKPSVDSPAVVAALESLRGDPDRRPGIRRSMTDTSLPRLGHESGSSRTSSAHGRSSPLKRISKTKRAKHRTSIALTIDENGRARAEARIVEGQEHGMDVDTESESSCTASSIDATDEDEMVSSFTAHAGPKLGRFGKPSSHSQKSSYTSFYSSSSYQDSQPSLPEINRASNVGGRISGFQTIKSRKEGLPILEDPESEAETVLDSDEGGDSAQSHLRKTMRGRQGNVVQPKNHMYSPLGISTATFGGGNFSSVSPTTISDPELPTPGSNSSHSEIRCTCRSVHEEGQMIQW
jgi:hypothetical protein